MDVQKIALCIFFPVMYACATTALIALWFDDRLSEDFFLLIPTFFIVGLAAFITWAVSVIIEFRHNVVARN